MPADRKAKQERAWLKMERPEGGSWEEELKTVGPEIDADQKNPNEGVLAGRWATCLLAAVKYEAEHGTEQGLDKEGEPPCGQVINLLYELEWDEKFVEAADRLEAQANAPEQTAQAETQEEALVPSGEATRDIALGEAAQEETKGEAQAPRKDRKAKQARAWLKMERPEGGSWEEELKTVGPEIDAKGVLAGPWATCLLAAVKYEAEHGTEQGLDKEGEPPCGQVINLLYELEFDEKFVDAADRLEAQGNAKVSPPPSKQNFKDMFNEIKDTETGISYAVFMEFLTDLGDITAEEAAELCKIVDVNKNMAIGPNEFVEWCFANLDMD